MVDELTGAPAALHFAPASGPPFPAPLQPSAASQLPLCPPACEDVAARMSAACRLTTCSLPCAPRRCVGVALLERSIKGDAAGGALQEGGHRTDQALRSRHCLRCDICFALPLRASASRLHVASHQCQLCFQHLRAPLRRYCNVNLKAAWAATRHLDLLDSECGVTSPAGYDICPKNPSRCSIHIYCCNTCVLYNITHIQNAVSQDLLVS